MSEVGFTFPTSSDIKVHVGGKEYEYYNEIEFCAPSSNDLKQALKLKQLVARAMTEAERKQVSVIDEDVVEKAKADRAASREDADEITPEQVDAMVSVVMAATASSSEVDLFEVISAGRTLFLRDGIATVAGKKLTESMLKCLSLDDLEKAVASYAANFSLKSLLS